MSITYVKVLLQDFVSLLYPEVCIHCKEILVKNENHLCTNCQLKLPYSYYHLNPDNSIRQSFAFIPTLHFATAFLKFHKGGIAQSVLHHLKYKGNYNLGVDFGMLMGKELKRHLSNYDMIIPIPLHHAKLRRRGYNQSTALAEGVSRETKIPVNDKIVIRSHPSKTQTKKSKIQRWQGIAGVYQLVDRQTLESKSVVLIDDVITTGATIGELAQLISDCRIRRIAIISLASGK